MGCSATKTRSAQQSVSAPVAGGPDRETTWEEPVETFDEVLPVIPGTVLEPAEPSTPTKAKPEVSTVTPSPNSPPTVTIPAKSADLPITPVPNSLATAAAAAAQAVAAITVTATAAAQAARSPRGVDKNANPEVHIVNVNSGVKSPEADHPPPEGSARVRVSLRTCVEVIGDRPVVDEKIALNTSARTSIRRGTGSISEEFSRRLVQCVATTCAPTSDSSSGSDAESPEATNRGLHCESIRERRLSKLNTPPPVVPIQQRQPAIPTRKSVEDFQPELVTLEADQNVSVHEGGWKADTGPEEEVPGRKVQFAEEPETEKGDPERKSSMTDGARRGTAFVSTSEIPCDDEDEETYPTSPKKKNKTQSASGDQDSVRKGTGFLRACDLPSSSDEEGKDDAKGVNFAASASASQSKNKKKVQDSVRKGTGFLRASDLPSSSEDDEGKPGNKGVNFASSAGQAKKKVEDSVRKGTGFLRASDLPSSSEEEEDGKKGAKGVNFAGSVSAGQGKKKKVEDSVRKGTGFLRASDLPSSSEEEEDGKKGAKGVNFASSVSAGQGKKKKVEDSVRKGTGFLRASDLPSSSEEEEDGKKDVKGVNFAGSVSAGQGKKKKVEDSVRKGTGFLRASDLPSSSDEDEGKTTKGVNFAEGATASSSSGKPDAETVRKGTGFLRASDLPSSSEDDEEIAKGVTFNILKRASQVAGEDVVGAGLKPIKASAGKRKRQCTGFLRQSDIPSSDDEEANKPAEGKSNKTVKLAVDDGGESQLGRKKKRQGTRYAAATASSEDDKDAKSAKESTPSTTDTTAKKKVPSIKSARSKVQSGILASLRNGKLDKLVDGMENANLGT